VSSLTNATCEVIAFCVDTFWSQLITATTVVPPTTSTTTRSSQNTTTGTTTTPTFTSAGNIALQILVLAAYPLFSLCPYRRKVLKTYHSVAR